MQDLVATASIRLPEEIVDYLQVIAYELEGLKVLHTHAVSTGLSIKKTMKIQKQFQEKYAEYQLAKSEVFARFGEKYKTCKRWWVDFQDGVMYFGG